MLGRLAGARGADKDKVSKDKLVGTWEITKSEEPPPPVGAVVEFTKDGKLKVTHKQDGKDVMIEGTYTIDGDKINVVIKADNNEVKHTVTVKKIGKDEISAENDKGKAVVFKRKASSK